MKIIRWIIKIYKIIRKIGSYIDFKNIQDDFNGKKMENNNRIRKPRNWRGHKEK